MKCPKCNGTGQVNNLLMNIVIGVFPVPIFKSICSKCKGEGKIDETN